MKERVTSDPPRSKGEENDGGRSTGQPDVERVRRQLVRSVNRVCPPWLADLREDIVQGAMVRLLEVLDRREHNPHLPASYVWKVAYTAVVDQIRRIRRQREVPIDHRALEGRESEGSPAPFRDRAARELGEGIQECLQRLAENRRLVVGFHLLGHTLTEIEIMVNWRPKKVRNLLYRGLADLRGCLTAKGLKP